jgi:hypothetical protein
VTGLEPGAARAAALGWALVAFLFIRSGRFGS